MGKETGISWTDHTFNPWWGCTKVSPGCDHCYAETQDAKFSNQAHWGKGVARRTFGEKHWAEPLNWQKAAAKAGRVDKVFCASMADVMDDESPVGEWEKLISLINETPNLLWQLLTKRPQRFVKRLPVMGFSYDNVILGTTTENQEFYDVRMEPLRLAAYYLTQRNLDRRNVYPLEPERRLVQTFVSYEPALGPITMTGRYKPDWLIFGGETGTGHRDMDVAWAENIKAECEIFGVAFFMKQMGAYRPATAAQIIPTHLLVRQFPEGA